MFGILLTQTSKGSQAIRNNMDHAHHHAGQSTASPSPDGAEPQVQHPLAQSELCIDENFLKPPKATERVEDPDDTFLIVDEDEEMTPSPDSSICGSSSDLRQLPQAPRRRKLNIKRAVKKTIDKNEKAKSLTNGVGSVAKSAFSVFGMARITGRKNSSSAKDVDDSSEDEFHLVSVEDGEEEADYQPLDLEPEEFIEYDLEIDFSSESEED